MARLNNVFGSYGELFISVLGIVAVVALRALRIAMSIWADEKRRAELNAFAAANGWTCIERDDSLTTRWKGQPFGRLQDKATDVFHGRFGPSSTPFIAFTYTYTVSRGKSTQTFHHEVCALQLPRALPYLSIAPEGVGDRVTKFFGSQDIDFESDDFNRAFRVQSADQRFAYNVIHPQFMEWVLGPGRALVPWRIDDAYIITYSGGQLDTNRFPQVLEGMTTLVHQIPQHVWDDFGR